MNSIQNYTCNETFLTNHFTRKTGNNDIVKKEIKLFNKVPMM